MKIQPVIMSGGAGTRLWPMSRTARPKQFLKLVTEKTMFQETVQRVSPDTDNRFAPPMIIAGAGHGPIITDQLEDIDVVAAEIILEPAPRNTAAVAAVASAWVEARHDDALIVLMPADHHIVDDAGFRKAVAHAAQAAEDGFIMTFGIKAESAHTGYGYIEAGDAVYEGVHHVAAFKEKPGAKTAQSYIDSGRFYWNAGIILFRASAMLRELGAHAPKIRDAATNALNESVMSGAARLLNEDTFAACPSKSIDYAVLEKTDRAGVVAPVDVGWTDIGSWSEVATHANDPAIVEVGGGDNIIRSEGVVVGAAGVSGLIIVATGDAVLVARKDDAQQVRTIVDELKKRGRTDLL